MTDEELRTLVRDAIQRHLGAAPPAAAAAPSRPAQGSGAIPLWRSHPSFGKFLVTRGEDEGGPCIIEPSVSCNHCGFCQTYGH
jgi:hypothetical protein